MTQEVFKICRSGNGLALLGVSIPQGLSLNDVFFSTSSYGKTKYVCTPRLISIPSKIVFEGELLDIVEICGHPFEECDVLEELVIPETIRKIHWNGCGRAKLSKFTVHPENPVFQDIEGVLYTRKGYNREGKGNTIGLNLLPIHQVKELSTKYPMELPDWVINVLSIQLYLIWNYQIHLEIGTNAFYGCRYLKNLEIPSSVIRNEGSRNCSTLFKTNNHG